MPGDSKRCCIAGGEEDLVEEIQNREAMTRFQMAGAWTGGRDLALSDMAGSRCFVAHPTNPPGAASLGRCSIASGLKPAGKNYAAKLRRLAELRHKSREQPAPVCPADDAFDVVFRMRHHAGDIAALVDDAVGSNWSRR